MNRDRLRKVVSHAYFPVVVLIVCNLLLGLVIGNDYGESWDENNGYLHAEGTIDAYAKLFKGEELKPKNFGPFTRRYYGPFSYAAGRILIWAMGDFPPGWMEVDRWHFTYFLAFQLAIFSFYYISLHLLAERWAAFGTTLLFTSQPLLWGHAFINPKDTPFMAFFLAAIAAGMHMVNAFVARKQPHLSEPLHSPKIAFADWVALVKISWRQTSARRKRGLAFASASTLLPVAVFFLAGEGIDAWVSGLVSAAYHNPDLLLGRLFALVARNAEAVSAAAYVNKALFLVARIKRAYSYVAVLAVFALYGVGVFKPVFARVWECYLQPALKWLYKHVPNETLFGGVVFGLCMGVRAYGFAAGGLVALYFLCKARARAIPALVAYTSVALVVMTVVWPYLWAAPLPHYYESLTVLSDYPSGLHVLFAGRTYAPKNLPFRYLGTLMAIQFTEPVAFLFLIGLVVSVVHFIRGLVDRAALLLIGLWFFVPFLLVSALKATIYDNFRQFLFIVPPVFMFAGLALKYILSLVSTARLKGLIVALVILPGIFSGVRLHPYQYIYYNSFIGGVNGASGKYEMDYWVTSYKDAIGFLNENAPHNASVRVVGPETVFRMYARPDLAEIQDKYSIEGIAEYDYALLPSRYNYHVKLYADAPVLYEVKIDEVVLAVVKQVPPDEPGSP